MRSTTTSTPLSAISSGSCVVLLFTLSVIALCGCNRGNDDFASINVIKEPAYEINPNFGIFWPPSELDRSLSESDEPLLHGEVSVRASATQPANSFSIFVTLQRPQSEAARVRWNEGLAFPEYSWMSKVRVWDRQDKWLWPNLSYLLRAHGQERIQRYGGVDPGKGIDNDFAAILIRPLESGSSESDELQHLSPTRPLVSAEWYSVDLKDIDRRSVVHVARSDQFHVKIPAVGGRCESGRLGVWLIYADFLGADVPRSWPRNDEYDGGILAYTQVAWIRNSDGEFEFELKHLVPPTDTGFDWAAWSTDDTALEKNLELTFPSNSSE
jgi:hypothetical protein